MKKYPAKFYAEFHEPKRNDECVCGSGIKFKKCCMGKYSSKGSEDFFTFSKKGDYEQALISIRQHLTWYVLSHKAHTVPFLESGSDEAKRMLSIDIEALSHYLGNLLFCYMRTGIQEEFIYALDVAENYVSDPRWDAKIAYHRGLWLKHIKGDSQAAFDQLLPIDVSECNDPEYLGLYIELYPKKFSFDEIIDLVNRILKNTKDCSVRLHYSVLKAIQYLLIEQRADYLKILDAAIDNFKEEAKDKVSLFGRDTLCYALQLSGENGSRPEITREAVSEIKSIVADGHNDGHLQRLLGDCYIDLNNYELAKQAYVESLSLEESELTKIFIAECALHQGEIVSARSQLQAINLSDLNDNGRFDLAIAWAKLAIKSLAEEDRQHALTGLDSVSDKSPYFRGYRDKLKIDILQITPKVDLGLIKRTILTINKYVMLQPNFCGLGININQIVEDRLSKPFAGNAKGVRVPA
jgi:tetratricopeptide (TPR) repeat protein